MKKLIALLFLVVCLVIQSGCSFNDQTLNYFDDDSSVASESDFDICLATTKTEDLSYICKICESYESEIGVKIRVEPFEKEGYIDKLKKSFEKNEGPSLVFTDNAKEFNNFDPLKTFINLYKSNNSELQKRLNKIQLSSNLIEGKSKYYGVILKLPYLNNETSEKIISISSRSNDLERKLSMDFVLFLLGQCYNSEDKVDI